MRAMTSTLFLTYADERFAASKHHLLRQAERSNRFTRVRGYGPSDLDKDFRRVAGRYLQAKRGGGF